jgi:hypothetical protein
LLSVLEDQVPSPPCPTMTPTVVSATVDTAATRNAAKWSAGPAKLDLPEQPDAITAHGRP